MKLTAGIILFSLFSLLSIFSYAQEDTTLTSKFDHKNFNISITIYSGCVTLISMGGGLSAIHGVFSPIEEANINLGADMRN